MQHNIEEEVAFDPFDETQVELIEYYINSNTSTDALSSAMGIFTSKCKMVLANNRAYEKMLEGMGVLAKVTLGAVEMVEAFPRENCPDINDIDTLTSVITLDHRKKLQTIAKKNMTAYSWFIHISIQKKKILSI